LTDYILGYFNRFPGEEPRLIQHRLETVGSHCQQQVPEDCVCRGTVIQPTWYKEAKHDSVCTIPEISWCAYEDTGQLPSILCALY